VSEDLTGSSKKDLSNFNSHDCQEEQKIWVKGTAKTEDSNYYSFIFEQGQRESEYVLTLWSNNDKRKICVKKPVSVSWFAYKDTQTALDEV